MYLTKVDIAMLSLPFMFARFTHSTFPEIYANLDFGGIDFKILSSKKMSNQKSNLIVIPMIGNIYLFILLTITSN